MAVKIGGSIVVEYERIYGTAPDSLSSYLKGISRETLLSIGTHFLGVSGGMPDHQYKNLLTTILHNNDSFLNDLITRIDNLTKQFKGVAPKIITPESSLTLFEYAYKFGGEENIKTSEEIEKSIILAYLAINDALRSKETLIDSSIKSHQDEYVDEHYAAASILTDTFPFSNLINYNESELIYAQFIKAFRLFEFLERSPDTQILLEAFLSDVKAPNWKEYLKQFLSIIAAITKTHQSGHLTLTVPNDENYEKNCTFLESLIADHTSYKIEPDFKIIRDKPLYRIRKGEYRIIFSLFVIEKIYKSQYFRLAKVNATLSKQNKIPDLQSLLGERFSEKILTYEILNRIYKDRYIKFTGQELKDMGIISEPDYYIRNGKRIFLFESKDFMIAVAPKVSFDFSELEPAFRKRLYHEGKTAKALLQLLGNIKRILANDFPPDVGITISGLEIYPIIVLHDHQYNALGLNKVVNKWFNEELVKVDADLLRKGKIHPITIIIIDSLIYHQDILRDKKIRLEDVIQAYNKFTTLELTKATAEEELMYRLNKCMIPFAQYLDEYIRHRKLRKQSTMINELAKDLFKDN